jgi:predicted Ser/Thr protein kinase
MFETENDMFRYICENNLLDKFDDYRQIEYDRKYLAYLIRKNKLLDTLSIKKKELITLNTNKRAILETEKAILDKKRSIMNNKPSNTDDSLANIDNQLFDIESNIDIIDSRINKLDSEIASLEAELA